MNWTRKPTEVMDGVFLTGEIPRETDFEDPGGRFFLDEDCTKPDPLLDDQALFFDTTDGVVVLLGCAHAGVVNTLRYIRQITAGRPLHAVLGGFHLLAAAENRMRQTLDALADLNLSMIGAAHCTGLMAMARLWTARFPPEQSAGEKEPATRLLARGLARGQEELKGKSAHLGTRRSPHPTEQQAFVQMHPRQGGWAAEVEIPVGTRRASRCAMRPNSVLLVWRSPGVRLDRNPRRSPNCTPLAHGDAAGNGVVEPRNMSDTPLPQLDDAELVRRAQAGELAAFETLATRHEQRVYALAMRILRNEHDAEDITQQAFLSALEHLDGFRRESTFSTWLLRIATYAALKIIRKRKGLDVVSLDEATDPSPDRDGIPHPEYIADWRESPERLVHRQETRRLIDEALMELDEKHRVVFVLRDIEGLSVRETAEVLGLTEVNVKVRLLRARLQLRERLTQAFGDPASRLAPHAH